MYNLIFLSNYYAVCMCKVHFTCGALIKHKNMKASWPSRIEALLWQIILTKPSFDYKNESCEKIWDCVASQHFFQDFVQWSLLEKTKMVRKYSWSRVTLIQQVFFHANQIHLDAKKRKNCTTYQITLYTITWLTSSSPHSRNVTDITKSTEGIFAVEKCGH